MKTKTKMANISINIPELYDHNIQKLKEMNIVPSRSEAVRTALREFIHNEYENLKIMGGSE